MENLYLFFFGCLQLVFILWFTFSVVEKLKRSELLLREILRSANPENSLLTSTDCYLRNQRPAPEPLQDKAPEIRAIAKVEESIGFGSPVTKIKPRNLKNLN
jgi:hypothetical protein